MRNSSRAKSSSVLNTAWILMASVVVCSGTAGAATVAAGYDLFETNANETNFGGVPFEGVGLDWYNFGGGMVTVIQTDTIVQRLADANCSAPCTDTVPIELIELQLKSVSPVAVIPGVNGSAPGQYYIRLSGAPSLGLMDITFDDDNGGASDSPSTSTSKSQRARLSPAQ